MWKVSFRCAKVHRSGEVERYSFASRNRCDGYRFVRIQHIGSCIYVSGRFCYLRNAAKVVKKAYGENITLKQAAADLGLMDGETFDRLIDPKQMI
ncbi:MAG: hypothetical protein IIV79_02005 [Clostridia bacterium]|nr:hypothetical protein [Clostridia bacterium]